MFNSKSFASRFHHPITGSLSYAVGNNILTHIRRFSRLLSSTIPRRLVNSISLLTRNNEFRNGDYMRSDARPWRRIKASVHQPGISLMAKRVATKQTLESHTGSATLLKYLKGSTPDKRIRLAIDCNVVRHSLPNPPPFHCLNKFLLPFEKCAIQAVLEDWA